MWEESDPCIAGEGISGDGVGSGHLKHRNSILGSNHGEVPAVQLKKDATHNSVIRDLLDQSEGPFIPAN